MNEKMSFGEFKGYVKEHVFQYLPEGSRERGVVIKEHQAEKINNKYDALMIIRPDSNVSPSINLNSCYSSYTEGMKLEMIMENIAMAYAETPQFKDIDSLLDLSEVKDKLYVRVCNAEKNKEVLKSIPHRIIEDLAITFHVKIDQQDMSMPITNQIIEAYGITVQELSDLAMESMASLWEPVIVNTMEGFRPFLTKEAYFDMLAVTNNIDFYGASVIFYPGMMEHIAEQLGGSFYIFPSSVHEILAVPQKAKELMDSKMSDMVSGINQNKSLIPNEIYLSDNVYFYDAERKIFQIAKDV